MNLVPTAGCSVKVPSSYRVSGVTRFECLGIKLPHLYVVGLHFSQGDYKNSITMLQSCNATAMFLNSCHAYHDQCFILSRKVPNLINPSTNLITSRRTSTISFRVIWQIALSS